MQVSVHGRGEAAWGGMCVQFGVSASGMGCERALGMA